MGFRRNWPRTPKKARESRTNLVDRERPASVSPKFAAPDHGWLGVLVVVGARDNVVPDFAIHVPLHRHDHLGRVCEVKPADPHVCFFLPLTTEKKQTPDREMISYAPWTWWQVT